MIQSFVDRFLNAKPAFEAKLRAKPPQDYAELVKAVVETITSSEDDEYDNKIDPTRIHEINDGDYQGTLVYVIAQKGYQPDNYWYVKVSYGSCSGCDTLEAIRDYSDEPLTDKQVKDYWTLALHIVQGLHKMGETAE